MDTIEKVYCTGHDNNDALVVALASKNNCDPMAMAAMMNQNDYMNNLCYRYYVQAGGITWPLDVNVKVNAVERIDC